MRTLAATALAAVAVLAGCGDEGALEIYRNCPPETGAPAKVKPADLPPECFGRDGLPDHADGKGQGYFRPRGF